MRTVCVLAVILLVSVGCNESTAPVERPGTWVTAAIGRFRTCGIATDGKSYCLGEASFGALGDAHAADSACVSNGLQTRCRATPHVVSGDARFTALAAAKYDTCGLDDAGAAWCWGKGGMLEFTPDSSSVPVKIQAYLAFKSIAVGDGFACGVGSKVPSVLCWGQNTHGQLGSGDFFASDTPRVIVNPPSGAVTYTAIVAGNQHACGLTKFGVAWCWGSNDAGQLGIESTTITESATPVQVSGGRAFVALAAGEDRTCGLEENGFTWCWGAANPYVPVSGSIGPAQILGRFQQIAVSDMASCGLTATGDAYCWGLDKLLLGQGDDSHDWSTAPLAVRGGHKFASIHVGERHACGITAEHEMWCWGWAHDGQLSETNFKESCYASDEFYRCTGTPVRVRDP